MGKLDPMTLLFGTYRRQVLDLLLARPDQSLHVREIARRTGVPVGSLHRELRALADAGVLERAPAGRQVRYRANRSCPIFESLASMFRSFETRVSEPAADYRSRESVSPRLARTLERLNLPERVLSSFARRHGLKRMAFFGSVTREDFRPESDVDVLVEFAGPRRDPFAKLNIADELSALFGGRNVDVVTPGVLANPFRRASIERDLLTIHGAR